MKHPPAGEADGCGRVLSLGRGSGLLGDEVVDRLVADLPKPLEEGERDRADEDEQA